MKIAWKRKLSASDPQAGPPTQVDVGALFPNSEVKLAVQPLETEGDAKVRRLNEVTGFILGVLAVLVSFGSSVYLLFFHPDADATEMKWALSSISAMLGAVGGYFVGRKA